MLMLMVGVFVGVLVSMDMDMDMFIPGIFGIAVGSVEVVGVGVGVVLGVDGVEMEGAWGEEMRGVVLDTILVR